MNKSRDIILVIPTVKQGGAERVISELANHWSCDPNLRVNLVLLAKSDRFFKIDERVVVHELGFENSGKFKKILEEVKTFFQLRQLIRDIRPNFVLSFMTKYNILVILATFFLKVRVIVSDRSNPLKKNSQIITILKKYLYGFANGIIAQTKFSREITINSTFNKNVVVIPNPVRLIQFEYSPKKKYILNIGRMVPEKGQIYLIEAFSKLQDTTWNLIILGDGPLRDQLLKKGIDLGVADRIIMPGVVQNIDKWLSMSSIFAFSSISEGFPNALIEAMSVGMPCVSFDCDAGPRDIIQDEVNGFLVPVANVDKFAYILNTLTNNESLRTKIGAAAKDISLTLNIDAIADRYLSFCFDYKL